MTSAERGSPRRKIINSTYITIDGVVENPHLWPSTGDAAEAALAVQTELLESCDTMLMGRRTYDSFSAVWPKRSDPFSDRMNAMPKVVVSRTLKNPTWENTTVISDDVVAELQRLKAKSGKHIVQYGIGEVTFALLEHGLLDELRLWTYPLILGKNGPASPTFRDCPPAQFRFVESAPLPNGVVIHRYDVNP